MPFVLADLQTFVDGFPVVRRVGVAFEHGAATSPLADDCALSDITDTMPYVGLFPVVNAVAEPFARSAASIALVRTRTSRKRRAPARGAAKPLAVARVPSRLC